MRRVLSILVPLALAGALTVTATASKHAGPTTGTVTATPTGDTLVVAVTSGKGKKKTTKRLRVPILGVHAPAGSSCYAAQSAAALRALALGKRVTLTGDLAHGAYVSVGGTDVGRTLVSSGAAEVDTFSAGGFDRLADYVPLQESAERAGTGMWGACAADVGVTMSGPDKGAPGDYLTYTASVTNAGPLTAQGVRVELRPGTYAKQITSVATTAGSCVSKDWVAYCTIDALGAGSGATITLVIRATQPGALTARATATSAGCIDAQCGSSPLQDPNLGNDRAAKWTIIPGGPYGLPGHECDPSYPTVCIPPSPPDLDCADFAPLKAFPVDRNVAAPDDHHLDGNNNGIACEGEDY